MEKQLSYVLTLSLQEMALRRIAVALYSEPSILASIAKSQFKPRMWGNIWDELLTEELWEEQEGFYMDVSYRIEWRTVVKDKISKLQLPKSLTEQMLPIVKAVGSEIYKWKWIHEAYLRDSNEDFNVHALEKLCWTTAGTVDHRKTAEQLVRCDFVYIVKRFEIACLYCLENYIPLLWEELAEENRNSFYNEEVTSRVETPHLQLFLPYILEREKSSVGRLPVTFSPRNSFEESALFGNKTLTEYCFRKLTKEEREASLVRTAKGVIEFRNYIFAFNFVVSEVRKGKLSEVLCYLLSLMTPEEQMGIFKELPCEVLRCFLDWPLQDLFLDIADVIFTFLPESKYKDLLLNVTDSIEKSGYYFPNFFQNLFLRSPIEFRKHFIYEEIQERYFFGEFFINEDTETIKVIFRNVDAADRVRLVSSVLGLRIIYQPGYKWHVKEAFLREATLSKEDKGRLKEAFIEFARRQLPKYEDSIDLVRRDYRRFFEFVEETDARAQSNRSSEDETLTRVKNLCCEKGQDSTE